MEGEASCILHGYIEHPDGTTSDIGGSGKSVGLISYYTIYIDENASCEEFTACVKRYFSSAGYYDFFTNNCHQVANRAIEACGGVK